MLVSLEMRGAGGAFLVHVKKTPFLPRSPLLWFALCKNPFPRVGEERQGRQRGMGKRIVIKYPGRFGGGQEDHYKVSK
jgi:hypothetical protein